MGMSQGTSDIVQALILGGLGFAGSAMNSPQIRQTFANGGTQDPQTLLRDQNQRLKGAYSDASVRAHSAVDLPSSYVQDVPTFTGGGLPMPIGVSGHDPALANPMLKHIFEGQIGDWQPSQHAADEPLSVGGKGSVDVSGPPAPQTDLTGNVPISTNLPGYRSLARRPLPGHDLFGTGAGTDPNQNPDLLQAHGAIDLLRHAIGG